MKGSIGNMSLCDVPESVRPIANAFCSTTLNDQCTKVPCALVYQSNETDKHEKYTLSAAQQFECIISPALELFMRGEPYPSLITNGYAHMTKQFYADVLAQNFRSLNSVWGLTLTGESVQYYPWCAKKSLLSLFDITLGYDRHLYDVISDNYLPYDLEFLIPPSRITFDTAIQTKQNLPSYITASIIWISGNCAALSNRTGYMKELMKYISVDSWGNCERNKGPELPPDIAKIHGVSLNQSHYAGNWVASKKAMMKHYKFAVAFENSFEYDYVTEKLWNPLAIGSVPLYYGAPNVNDWLPCQNCIIDLRQFSSPKEAAEYITHVSKNDTLYAQYHKWRTEPIPPKFQKILDYFKRANTYSWESMVCAMAHSKNPSLKRHEILDSIGPIF